MSAKILIVDDTKLNIKLLTDILENHGYEVYSLNSGFLVQDTAKRISPDIILLDIMMPGIDGFEVCRILKQDSELMDIPVIMVTARTEGADIKKALELGAFDYIKKPIDEWEVVARVQSALRFKKNQDMLKDLAIKDRLTGLYNHALIIELLKRELAKQGRRGSDLCFGMIDIDYFKKVNDTYGHMVGDVVLNELSNMLVNSVRKSDIIGRYGGDEFSVILPEITLHDSICVFERIRQSVDERKYIVEDKTIHITISTGICFKRAADNLSYADIIKKADEALYLSKGNGRNRIEISPV